ncbi:MAG: acyl-CoA reductase [Bacteroidales bacterium]|nr:acyl-CoA reductase [Bacteroidales bacterium]MDG2081734.1 acyl-CoA reductase [Bacteroidales bacterium]
MISLSHRINTFEKLGNDLLKVSDANSDTEFENKFMNSLNTEVSEAALNNGWFVELNVRFMLKSIAQSLSKKNLTKWIEPYMENLASNNGNKVIGVVMAGNIPMVGFHDLLCVLMSGNKLFAKLSSDDNKLIPSIANLLIDMEPSFSDYITFTSGKLEKIDAIIATGSDNSSRYFEYYFGKYPNIIRKNRNGIAVLDGNETNNQMTSLMDDIFMYYGLGCRNISHLFVPINYDFTPLLDLISQDKSIAEHHKYFNNYEYNKAIYLVNGNQHLDSGNLMLVENTNFSNPVSVLSYEYYTDIDEVNKNLKSNKDKVQCIVAENGKVDNSIPFGTSQSPQLWDYADGVDTMEFVAGI